MTLSDPQKVAVAAFAQHYMYAVTGMQLRDLDLRVIDPKQFAVTLACGLYAAGQLQGEGILMNLPHADDRANYSEFGKQVAQRYAELVNDTAVATVDELVEKLDLGKISELGEAHHAQIESLLSASKEPTP